MKISEAPSSTSPSGDARPQLSSARSQIAHVQELIYGVERRIGAFEQGGGRRRHMAYHRPRSSPLMRHESTAFRKEHDMADSHRRLSAEEDHTAWDLLALKSEIYRLKAKQKKLSARRDSLTSETDESHQPDVSQPHSIPYTLRRSRSDETSNVSSSAKKQLAGVLKSGTSVDRPQQHRSVQKRVSFIHCNDSNPNEHPGAIPVKCTPIDPDADLVAPRASMSKVVAMDFPVQTPSPSTHNFNTADDQTALRLFTFDNEANDMSNTVMATITPPIDGKNSTSSKINNR